MMVKKIFIRLMYIIRINVKKNMGFSVGWVFCMVMKLKLFNVNVNMDFVVFIMLLYEIIELLKSRKFVVVNV